MITTRGDDRGVSEFAGVVVLVALTVLVTASVGIYVIAVEEDDGAPTANFTFQYVDQSSVLVITHDHGDEFAAGNLTVRSATADAGWDELAGTNASAPVGPGARVQIGPGNVYSERVSASETIQVVYRPSRGNETVLSTWNGS